MAGDQVMGEFKRNSRETIRALLQEFRGKPVFSVRVWYRDLDDQWKPGRNGITLGIDHFGEFEKLIKALGDQIQKDG